MLLKNANILTSEWKIIKGNLRVSNGKIAQIGSLEPFEGEAVFDCQKE